MKNISAAVSKYMTISECSSYFGISKYQIRRWIADGKVSYVFIGNRYRIEVETLSAMIQKCTELKGG